ncbi:TPA: hypothetical protein ACS781_000022 [Providencia alcalifaciens]
MTIEERLEKLESAVKLLLMKQTNKELEDCQTEIDKTEKRLAILKETEKQKQLAIKSSDYL